MMLTKFRTEVANFSRRMLGGDLTLEDLAEYKQQLEQGKLSFEQVLKITNRSRESEAVFQPLITEIKEIYTKFLFREPKPVEILQHITNFYQEFSTSELRKAAIERKDIRPYLGIRPLKLEMDIVNQCNLRCIMCHFSSESISKRKKAEVSLENFSKIAEQLFPLCSHVSLSISTEPLLHSQLEQILKITGKYKIPFVYMHTNATLINERIIEQLIESKFSQLSISIDGGTKSTYERIRIGGKFDKLIANIEAINRAKERTGSITPHLGFNIVLMRSNITELPAIIEIAKDLKVETVGAVHLVPLVIAAINSEEESLNNHKVLCNQMLEEARTLAKKYQINISLPEPFIIAKDTLSPELSQPESSQPESSQPESTDSENNHRDLLFLPTQSKNIDQPCCFFPWHFVGLDSDGNLMPCGWWYNQPPMGNILESSFEEIWNNEAYRTLRSELTSRKLRDVCQMCPAAGMGNINNENAFVER